MLKKNFRFGSILDFRFSGAQPVPRAREQTQQLHSYSVSWWFEYKTVKEVWRSVTASYNTEYKLTPGSEISLPSKIKTHVNKNPLRDSGSFTGALIPFSSFLWKAMLFIMATSESNLMVL